MHTLFEIFELTIFNHISYIMITSLQSKLLPIKCFARKPNILIYSHVVWEKSTKVYWSCFQSLILFNKLTSWPKFFLPIISKTCISSYEWKIYILILMELMKFMLGFILIFLLVYFIVCVLWFRPLCFESNYF